MGLEKDILKLEIISEADVDPSVGTQPTVLFNPDGSPYVGGPPPGEPVDTIVMRASDDSLWEVTVTTDGTLDISEVV